MLAAVMAAACIGGCGGGLPAASSPITSGQGTAGIPAGILAAARPIGRGLRFHPPAVGPVVGGCRSARGARYGVHIEVFAANRVVIIPAGIGTKPPRRYEEGRIAGASCYGALVTLEPTGVVLVRPGPRLHVSDLFRSWGQALSIRRLGPFVASRDASVAVFVDGRRWPSLPGRVPLSRHAEIVLEVGPHVPPHSSYTFPPGS